MSDDLSHSSSIEPNVTRDWYAALRAEMGKSILGQAEVIEQLLLAVLCREHALLVGPAGTAKWTAVESLGNCLGITSGRWRCSPDMNWDDVLLPGVGRDPWRASLLLVDNVDSLPAKLRNVLQQAMCERVVVTGDVPQAVPDPFVVFATRNRCDDLPTGELPDPQDDRFLFQIDVPYPKYHDEFALAAAKSSAGIEPVLRVVSESQWSAWRSLVPQIEAPPSVVHYAVRLVRATRVHEGENPDFIYEWVQQGAGPRAAHFLVLAAKARATLFGRASVTHDDVQAVCLPVLRHRIVPNENARLNGIGSNRVIRRLIEEVPPCIVGDEAIPAAGDSFTFHDWIPDSDRGR